MTIRYDTKIPVTDGEILEAKNINIKPSFDGFLQQFGNRKELKELSPQEIRAVYQKLFAILNRAETLESNTKPSTANISGIFNL